MNRDTLVHRLSQHCPSQELDGIMCGDKGVCGKFFDYHDSDPRTQWAEHVADVIYPRSLEHVKTVEFKLTELDTDVLGMIYGDVKYEGRDDMEGKR